MTKKFPIMSELQKKLMNMPLSAVIGFTTTEEYGDPVTRGVWPWNTSPIDGYVETFILDARDITILARNGRGYVNGSREYGNTSPSREIYDFWDKALSAADAFRTIAKHPLADYGERNQVSFHLTTHESAMRLMVEHPQVKKYFNQPGVHTVIRRQGLGWSITYWQESPVVSKHLTQGVPESSFVFIDTDDARD